MIKDTLKTLSDTELVAIAFELNDPGIDNVHIFKQLIAKSNESFVEETTTEKLVCEVAKELATRLLERDVHVVDI